MQQDGDDHQRGRADEGDGGDRGPVRRGHVRILLRERVQVRTLPPGAHIQGIITHGGEATNIIPDHTEARFGLRALTTSALTELVNQVTTAAHGIAAATATTVEVDQVREPYAHFRPNDVLSGRFDEHIAKHGITMTPPDPGVFLGSSDIGNVSVSVPAIHPFLAIMDSTGSAATAKT
ncbi:peptidase dimerization domain-containing protein [Kibdelosporangium lantanae]|uniref:Peptidase dimerization domain-containing protein n=1 Tax=Kibdelosporangium lantanae TaxID=1497396 RepID=A0ABW3M6P5_9PSEU